MKNVEKLMLFQKIYMIKEYIIVAIIIKTKSRSHRKKFEPKINKCCLF